MESDPKKTFDDLIAALPRFKAVSRNAMTREERDDPKTIFGVKTYADLSREVRRRMAPDAPNKANPKL